jgi:hypothetical protein
MLFPHCWESHEHPAVIVIREEGKKIIFIILLLLVSPEHPTFGRVHLEFCS